MKNLIERIKRFTQSFFGDVMNAFSRAFAEDEPVLAPIRVKAVFYYSSRRNPYGN